MGATGILLVGFLLMVLGVCIASAIIAAAPAIAVCVVIGLVLLGIKAESDETEKPP
jgi:FtsH-binding integral membrane protein